MHTCHPQRVLAARPPSPRPHTYNTKHDDLPTSTTAIVHLAGHPLVTPAVCPQPATQPIPTPSTHNHLHPVAVSAAHQDAAITNRPHTAHRSTANTVTSSNVIHGNAVFEKPNRSSFTFTLKHTFTHPHTHTHAHMPSTKRTRG